MKNTRNTKKYKKEMKNEKVYKNEKVWKYVEEIGEKIKITQNLKERNYKGKLN